MGSNRARRVRLCGFQQKWTFGGLLSRVQAEGVKGAESRNWQWLAGLDWQQGPQSRERSMGHVTMDPGKVLRYGLKRDTEVGYWG